jgi:hypothetical protein
MPAYPMLMHTATPPTAGDGPCSAFFQLTPHVPELAEQAAL